MDLCFVDVETTGLDPVRHELIELAAARFGRQASDLAPEDDLFEALGIDSVQALELLSELERTFGIELPDYELAEVRTFADLAFKVDERR